MPRGYLKRMSKPGRRLEEKLNDAVKRNMSHLRPQDEDTIVSVDSKSPRVIQSILNTYSDVAEILSEEDPRASVEFMVVGMKWMIKKMRAYIDDDPESAHFLNRMLEQKMHSLGEATTIDTDMRKTASFTEFLCKNFKM